MKIIVSVYVLTLRRSTVENGAIISLGFTDQMRKVSDDKIPTAWCQAEVGALFAYPAVGLHGIFVLFSHV